MPLLQELKLPPLVHQALAPLVGQWNISKPGGMVWVEHGRIRMELEDVGEGRSGDYNPDDPADTPMLRFSFYAKNPGDEYLVALDNTSYCSSIDARAPWEVQIACACDIFSKVIVQLAIDHEDDVDCSHGNLARRACEDASWTSCAGHEELLAIVEASRQALELSAGVPGGVEPPRSNRARI